MNRRIASFVLVLVVLFSLLPMGAQAQEPTSPDAVPPEGPNQVFIPIVVAPKMTDSRDDLTRCMDLASEGKFRNPLNQSGKPDPVGLNLYRLSPVEDEDVTADPIGVLRGMTPYDQSDSSRVWRTETGNFMVAVFWNYRDIDDKILWAHVKHTVWIENPRYEGLIEYFYIGQAISAECSFAEFYMEAHVGPVDGGFFTEEEVRLFRIPVPDPVGPIRLQVNLAQTEAPNRPPTINSY